MVSAAIFLALAQPSLAHASVGVADNSLGFDRRCAPLGSKMTTWWNNTNYYYIGIYLGGSNVSCTNNSNLTASWITNRNTSPEGWAFLPLWVGLQDPCTSGFSTFSTDPNTALSQGHAAADNAISAAQALGFDTGGVIYYDLEGYGSGTSCESAANNFMHGYDERMTTNGWIPAVYGSSCSSNMTDLWNLMNNPTDGWTGIDAQTSAKVWDISCVTNTPWELDRRVHQYTNGHDETHGGDTITSIINDCAVGQYDKANFVESDAGGTDEANGPTEDPSCS